MKKDIIRDRYLLLLFFIPFLYIIIFKYVPMYGVSIAFKDYNFGIGIAKSPWVGFKYFEDFLQDPYFWKLMRNTLLLSFYALLFGFPAPIALALLLNEIRNDKFKKFVQTVSYLPHFISTVVICGMIVNFLSNQGILNNILANLGLSRVNFLMKAEYFRTIYVTSGIWQSIGWGSIIYLAALTGIDMQLYEAAIIDGAGRWKRMLHVTLPGIAPTIVIMLIMQIGNLLSVSFEKILLLYNGSTYETADVISTYVYRRGLVGSDFSYATAVDMFQSVIGIILIVTANWISKKFSETSLF